MTLHDGLSYRIWLKLAARELSYQNVTCKSNLYIAIEIV